MTNDTADGLDQFIAEILKQSDPLDSDRPKFFLLLESFQGISRRISSSTVKGDEDALRAKVDTLKK